MSGTDISGMDLGRLKVQLRSQLKARRKAELARHRRSVATHTNAALRAITAAKTEGEAYDALQHYTRMLAWLRGVPLNEVRA